MGFLSIGLAIVVAGACDKGNRRDMADARAGNPAAVGTSGEADRNKVSRSDQDFVQELTIANMAEVELGRMAGERSANADVKKFGQMMVNDHTAAGDKLKGIASQYKLTVPAALDDKHRDLRDKLAKLNGAEFDREYMEAMVDGHHHVAGQLESRIDKETLGKWKTETADAATGKKVVERAKATTVAPEKSDDAVTMSLNEWSAEAYPVVQAHLQAAKVLEGAVKNRRSTN